MPIRMIVRNRTRDVPVVVCDHCDQEIAVVGDGNVEFRAIDIADAHFVHKGCSQAFAAARPYTLRRRDLGTVMNRLLDYASN